MEININKENCILKYSIRMYFIFEALTDRSYNAYSIQDNYILFYSCLLANNKETFKLQFDEFIEYLDNHPTIFKKYQNWLLNEIKIQNQFFREEDEVEVEDTTNDQKKK